jgi:hypothetical protein
MAEVLVAEKGNKTLDTAVLDAEPVSKDNRRYHSEHVLRNIVAAKKPVYYCWDNCGRIRIDEKWGFIPPDINYLVNPYIREHGSTAIHPECEERYRRKNSELLK